MKKKTKGKEQKEKTGFEVYGFDKIEIDRMFDRGCDIHTTYMMDPKIKMLEDALTGMVNELFPDSNKGERCKMAMLMLVQYHSINEQLAKKKPKRKTKQRRK